MTNMIIILQVAIKLLPLVLLVGVPFWIVRKALMTYDERLH